MMARHFGAAIVFRCKFRSARRKLRNGAYIWTNSLHRNHAKQWKIPRKRPKLSQISQYHPVNHCRRPKIHCLHRCQATHNNFCL